MVADDLAVDMRVALSAEPAIEERFRDLLDKNRPALSRLAASYTRSASDRDDLLQEKHYASVAPEALFASWPVFVFGWLGVPVFFACGIRLRRRKQAELRTLLDVQQQLIE